MSKIVLGKSHSRDVVIDEKVLMTTRLLITSDSGGGKTWLLKRLIEQSFGKVGIIVIDPEGEFAPLRTKFDFFLVGKGGDTPADIRTAGKVAHALLRGHASAICDIYDMAASERHIWVKTFIDALLDAPKELRHPYFVIVDEAHMFAPEHGKGESIATDAMKGLGTRGRKRMLCGIFATQRLATLAKDLTGMCLNRLIGPTFESINQQRAALELGIPKGSDQVEFFAKVKMLDPGNFYAIGRAITKDLELVRVGPIETPHGQDALKYELKPPPPTEKVREWLTNLGDLPKQVEDEARTVADFKKQIRDLKSQLRSVSTEARTVAITNPKTIEQAVRDAVTPLQRMIETYRMTLKAVGKMVSDIQAKIDVTNATVLPKTPPVVTPYPVSTVRVYRSPRVVLSSPATTDDMVLTGPEKRILLALGELAAIGRNQPPKEMCASWAQYSPVGGAFGNPIGKLRTAGLIEYPSAGYISLTEAGHQILPSLGFSGPPSLNEVKRRIERICTGPEWKILSALLEHGPEPLAKDELAHRSGYTPVGGAFGNPIGALRTKGLLDYPRPGQVQASDWLFTEID